MRRTLRLLLRSLRLATIAVVAVLVVVIAALAFLFSAPGRPLLADGLSRAARAFAGLDLTIAAVGPGLPTRIDLAGVELGDEQGVWLRIGGAVVSWSALALLSGTVHVDEISGSGIEVIRAPLPGAEPAEPDADDAALSLPQIPVSVRVDRIDIADLALGPDLLGEAFRLRITGEVAAAVGARINTTLAIDRLDGSGGRIAALITADPAAATLAVNVTADEPAGGLIVHSLGLAPYPPVHIALAGEGPIAAWSGRLTAVIDGLADVGFDLQRLPGDLERLQIRGGGSVDGLVPESVRALTDGGVSLDATVATDGETVIDAEALTVATAALKLTAAGRVDLEQQSVEARATVVTLDAAHLAPLIAPATVDSATVEVRASGALTAPAVELALTAPVLAVPGQLTAGPVALDAAVTPAAADPETLYDIAADLRLGRVEVGGAAGVNDLFAAGAALTLAGQAATDGSRVRLDSLSVDAGPVRVAASGEINPDSDRIALRAEATVADLAALAGLAGLPLKGAAVLRATADGSVAAADVSAEVALALTDAGVGEPAVDALLSPSTTLAAQIRLDGGDALSVEPLTLTASGLQGQGRLRLDGGLTRLDAALQLVLADLAPVLKAAGLDGGGGVTIDLAASETIDDPTVTATVTSSSLSVAGNRIDNARVTARAATVVSAPTGAVAATAGTPYGPARANVDFALSDGDTLRLPALSVSAAGLELSGAVTAALSAGTVEGGLRGQWRAPGGGLVVGDQRLGGRADLSVNLAAPAGRQRLEAGLGAADLVLADRAGAETVRIGSLSLTADASDVFGQPALDARFAAAAVTAGGRTLDRVEAEARGSLADLPFRLAVSGGDGVPASIDGRGRLAIGAGDPQLRLDALSGDLAGQRLGLSGPATVTLGETIVVAGLAVTVGDGSIVVDGRLAPAGPTATVRVDSLPLALTAVAAPDLALSGAVDAQLDLAPQGRLLGGTVAVTVRDLERGQSQFGLSTVPPLTVRAEATLAGGRLGAGLRVVGLGGDDLVVRADLPAAIDAATLAPRDPGNAPISGSVRWAGNLEPLVEAAPVEDIRVTGRGRIDLQIGGTLEAPTVSGDITAEQGRLEHLVAGTQLRDLDVRVGVDALRRITAGVSGTDGQGGRVSAEAAVDLGAEPITIQAAATSRNAILVRRDDVVARADADVSFRDDGSGRRAEGRIETREVEVRLVNQLPPSVVELEVIEIDRYGNRMGDPAAAAADRPIDLAVDVAMPARVFVRGRGLDSEWRGALTIRGTSARPDIRGQIEIIRGELGLAGRTFRLTEGVITFRGGGAIDPELAIAAESTANGITGVIRVTGRASAPELKLSASDGRPQSEVLPLLLFGKRADQLGASEAVQLALALDTLAGGGGLSEDIMFGIRETLGLDVLSVESGSGSGEDATVRAGAYLGDNIYVETRQGTQPGTSTYRAEVRITDQIAIESELGQGTRDTSGSIGLRWQLDY